MMERKLNVLLVDDSRTVLAQLEQLLGEIEGLAIVGMAQSGAAAIRMANESSPDLVLMDIMMPGVDALSALRTIRLLHPDIEVVMVSSLGGEQARIRESFKLGASRVIEKPFDADEIEALIDEMRSGFEHASSARD